MTGVPPAPLVVAVALSAASLAGAIHLALDETPFDAGAAALIAAGLIVLAVVAVSGVLLARGRWSQSVAAIVAFAWISASAAGGASVAGSVAITAGAVALAAALGPWLRRWVRHRPAIQGPPPAAVATLLLLLAVPAAVGATVPDTVGWPAWSIAAWAVGLAFALGRAVPGALSAVRLVHAPASIAAGVASGILTAVVVGGLGIAAAVFAWQREVAIAVSPAPGRSGSPVRIPPELAPPGVLDAAGVDEDGRR